MTAGWQGLYFKQHFYWVALALALAASIGWLVRKQPYAYSYFIAITVVPLLPLFSGVKLIEVSEGWVHFAAYALLFILLQTYSTRDHHIFYGIGIVTMIWCYILPSIEQTRYGGIFEYANTNAIIIGSFFLFGVLQYVQAKRYHWLWLLPLLPMMALVVVADSKGGMLALVISWLIALALLTFDQQLKFLLITIVHLLVVWWLPLPWLILGLIPVVIVHRIVQKLPKLMYSRAWLPISSAVIAMMIMVKMGAIDVLRHGTAQERFVHWRDGMALAQEKLWFGHGYGGFAKGITPFQSEPYRTLEAHSGYLDSIINYGVVGTLLLVISGIWIAYRIYQQWLPSKVAPFIFMVAILLHSAVDFTLSFGFVVVLLIWAMHLLYTPKTFKALARISQLSLALAIIAIFYITSTTLLAYGYDKQLAHATNLEAYEKLNKRAVALDPGEPIYALKQLELAVKLYEQTQTTIHYKKIQQTADKLAQQFTTNPNVLLAIAKQLETVQQYEQSQALIEQVIKLDRYEAEAYALGVKIATQQALVYYAERDKRYQKTIAKAYAYEQQVLDEQQAFTTASRRWDFRVTEEAQYYLALIALMTQDDEALLTRTLAILYATYPEALPYKEHAAALRVITLRKQGQYDEAKRWQKQYPSLRTYEQQYEGLQQKLKEGKFD